MTDIPPDEVWPCGCLVRCSIDDGIKTATLIPCRQTCPNYRDLIAYAVEQGKPIEEIDR